MLRISKLYNKEERQQKAKKILAVLQDYYSHSLDDFTILEIGCGPGEVTNYLSDYVRVIVGIDINKDFILYANLDSRIRNGYYYVMDATKMNFSDSLFDIAICSQVLEHVDNPNKLMQETYRVLKPKGICYLAVPNKWQWREPHYNLLLLSVLPRWLSYLYLLALNRGPYDVYMYTLTTLKKLVSSFEVIDYTKKIITDPEKYYATEMLKPNSLKQKIALWFVKYLYYFFPTYIWLLRKEK